MAVLNLALHPHTHTQVACLTLERESGALKLPRATTVGLTFW
jgi:hypothetical protein